MGVAEVGRKKLFVVWREARQNKGWWQVLAGGMEVTETGRLMPESGLLIPKKS